MESCAVLDKSEFLRAVNFTEIDYLADDEVEF